MAISSVPAAGRISSSRATHLAMLEAIAGRQTIERAYALALEHEYLWHNSVIRI